MNENTTGFKDTQLVISEYNAALGQQEDLDSFPQGEKPESPRDLDSNSHGTDLSPSNPLGRTFEEDYKRSLMLEEEVLLSSSDDVILKDLAKEKKRKINKCLNSTFKWFFTTYCEVSMVACTLRERWVLLLSVLICSKAALEVKNTEILVPRLFLVSYCCLVYHMIEKMYQYRFLRTTTNLGNEKAECLFDFADKAIILFFVLILNLQYNKLINAWFMLLPPMLFLLAFILYRRHGSQEDMKMVKRIFYVLQSLMIALKMTNILGFQWKTTLSFLVVYLAINCLYAILAGLLLIALCLIFFLNFDLQTFRVLRDRVLGYIWNIGFSLINVACLITLLGFFDKIGSNGDDTFEWGLEISRNLSFLLVIFSAFLFPILKKQDFNLFQDLRTTLQNQMTPLKKYDIVKTEEKNRKAFFLMVSSTYFNRLRNVSQTQFEEMVLSSENSQNKKDLCYICENHVSNAILAECGHGGVCCECALKLIEQKNECMGCRKPATAIYKIENNSMNDPAKEIVQAKELVKIIKIEEFDVES